MCDGHRGPVSHATSAPTARFDQARRAVGRLVAVLLERDLDLAIAESLTGGLASYLVVDQPDSGKVHLGAVVAYESAVKQRVLGVGDGPVVTGRCAQEMAVGVQRLIGAHCALAFTGVAGPATQEGCPVGTVFIAARAGDRASVLARRYGGEPDAVRAQAVIDGAELLCSLVAVASPVP